MSSKSLLVLIDSSAWIEALRPEGQRAYREMIDELLAEDVAATCQVVIAEVLQGARSPKELAALGEELRALRCLSMEGVGERAGEIAFRLRKQGQRIPTTDLLIAATAAVHETALLHRDEHLDVAAEIAGLHCLKPNGQQRGK